MNKDFHLDADTWDNLSLITDVLQIMADKTNLLQAEKLTMSDAYGIWLETEARLAAMPDNPTAVKMLERLVSRRESHHIIENDVMYSAMFLDPRFQFMLTDYQKAEAIKHLTYLNQKLNLKKNIHEPQSQPVSQITAMQRHIEPSSNVLEQILQRNEISRNNVRVAAKITPIDQLQIEIRNFDGIPRSHAETNVRSFWKKIRFDFPTLYELCQVVFAVPSSQTGVERNFSALDFIFNKRRNRLSDDSLEMVLTLKLNKSSFYEVFENNEYTFD